MTFDRAKSRADVFTRALRKENRTLPGCGRISADASDTADAIVAEFDLDVE